MTPYVLAGILVVSVGCNPQAAPPPQNVDAPVPSPVQAPASADALQRVDVKGLHDRLEADEVSMLLDVRSAQEFADGHVLGAQNLPLDQLDSSLEFLEAYREQPIYVMCRSGGRSQRAAGLLKGRGFHVVDVTGGLIAWQNAGLPIEK